uniref:Spindle pole body component n=1 Tax=Macrostomum lignano TaxID=282301 RepID=A0A1I8JQF3_9PLAT
ELPDVCESNPGLLEPFLGHLLSRLDRLMPSDRLADPDQAPVDFSPCFGPAIGGGVALLEPLVISRANSLLSNAAARFASAELEELEVDATSEYCGAGDEAVKSLMLHEMSTAASATDLPDRLVALYRQRRLLCEVIDKKRANATATAGPSAGNGRRANNASAAAGTSAISSSNGGAAGQLAWPVQPDSCGQLRLDETCQMLCRALTASPSSSTPPPRRPETRADLSQFLLDRARLPTAACPAAAALKLRRKQFKAMRQLCKVSLSFYGHSVKRITAGVATNNSSTAAADTSGVGAGPAPISMTVHRCVHRVMQAALSLASAISDRWTGRQLNSVSINSQSLADNLRHWTAALPAFLLCLDPGQAYLHFAESLLRSEAVANGALKDDAASTRAVAALLARNCLPSPSTRRWRKRGWRQRRRRSSSAASRRRRRIRLHQSSHSADSVLQALVGELGFALDELDWILSASGGASSSALQSVESFRSVASRFGLLSRLVHCLASMGLKPGAQTGPRDPPGHQGTCRFWPLWSAAWPPLTILAISPSRTRPGAPWWNSAAASSLRKIYDRVLQKPIGRVQGPREAARKAARRKKDKKQGKKNGGGAAPEPPRKAAREISPLANENSLLSAGILTASSVFAIAAGGSRWGLGIYGLLLAHC